MFVKLYICCDFLTMDDKGRLIVIITVTNTIAITIAIGIGIAIIIIIIITIITIIIMSSSLGKVRFPTSRFLKCIWHKNFFLLI